MEDRGQTEEGVAHPSTLSCNIGKDESCMTLEIDKLAHGGNALVSSLVDGVWKRRSWKLNTGDLMIVLTRKGDWKPGYLIFQVEEEGQIQNFSNSKIVGVFFARASSGACAKQLPRRIKQFLGGEASRVDNPAAWPGLVAMKLSWGIDLLNRDTANTIALRRAI